MPARALMAIKVPTGGTLPGRLADYHPSRVVAMVLFRVRRRYEVNVRRHYVRVEATGDISQVANNIAARFVAERGTRQVDGGTFVGEEIVRDARHLVRCNIQFRQM